MGPASGWVGGWEGGQVVDLDSERFIGLARQNVIMGFSVADAILHSYVKSYIN